MSRSRPRRRRSVSRQSSRRACRRTAEGKASLSAACGAGSPQGHGARRPQAPRRSSIAAMACVAGPMAVTPHPAAARKKPAPEFSSLIGLGRVVPGVAGHGQMRYRPGCVAASRSGAPRRSPAQRSVRRVQAHTSVSCSGPGPGRLGTEFRLEQRQDRPNQRMPGSNRAGRRQEALLPLRYT